MYIITSKLDMTPTHILRNGGESELVSTQVLQIFRAAVMSNARSTLVVFTFGCHPWLQRSS